MPKAAKCYPLKFAHSPCAKCGQHPVIVHVPVAYVGYFCSECCPACRLEAAGEDSLRGTDSGDH
jgi:hypothetical protein